MTAKIRQNIRNGNIAGLSALAQECGASKLPKPASWPKQALELRLGDMSEKSDPAFRVIIQFVAAAEGTPAHYRVIAYRDKIALGPAKFYSAEELSQKLKKAGLPPGQEPELPAQELRETKVVYAEEVALSSRQLQLLGLNEH